MARPKKYIVRLSDANIVQLHRLIKKKDTSDTIANRCRILLDMDENHPPVLTQAQCAKAHGISQKTVANTVLLFCSEGLDSVLAIKRNVNSDQARRKVDGRTEAKLIEVACGPAPEGHSRWTIRLLEEEMKIILDEPISREAIRRTLKKTGLDLTAANTGVSRT